jgi:small subunit ribosomal protein S20
MRGITAARIDLIFILCTRFIRQESIDTALRDGIVPRPYQAQLRGCKEQEYVANHASALKRARQDQKKRLQNRTQKSTMRTVIKQVLAAVEAGDKETATAALRQATSLLDRAGRKNQIHARQASRRVSRLNASVKAIA